MLKCKTRYLRWSQLTLVFFQNMHNTLFNWLIFQFAHMVPIFKLLVSSAIRNNDNKVTFVSCGWLNSKLNLPLWCQFSNFYYQVAIEIIIIKWWALVSCGWLNSKPYLHLWCQFSNSYYQVAIRIMLIKWPLVSCGWRNLELNLHLWCQFSNFYYQVAIRIMILKWPLVSCGWLNLKLNLHLWCQFK